MKHKSYGNDKMLRNRCIDWYAMQISCVGVGE